MSSSLNLHVSIGELKIGRGDQVLFATLGSCVGLAFLWRRRNLCGLAHCLLPTAGPNDPVTTPARYVSRAVPAMISAMGILPSDAKDVDVILVGGGNMTALASTPAADLIGSQNVVAAELHLRRHGFEIRHRAVRGTVGRRISVRCGQFDYEVKEIPRLVMGAVA